MDSDVVKSFNKMLVSMQDSKGGVVSKQKVVEITKAAMNAIRYFKHVVFILERYLAKCRQEFKIPALYIIDSILRQARKQYKYKDVFAPRFAVNLQNTIINVLECEPSDKLKVVRVINLWKAHQIFNEEIIDTILLYCQQSGLETETQRVESLVKGDKADMQIYNQPPDNVENIDHHHLNMQSLTPIKNIPTATTPITSCGSKSHQSLDERLSQFSRQKLGLERSESINATPKTIESGPKTPPLEDQDHRIFTGQVQTSQSQMIESPPESGLNVKDISEIISSIGVQAYSMDGLQRVRKFLNGHLQEHLEIDRRRQGNIKNLLSRDFDYSDEEEDNHDSIKNNIFPGSPKLSDISKEKLYGIAREVIADPTVLQEIKTLAIDTPSAITLIQPPNPALNKFTMPDFSVPPPTILPQNLNFHTQQLSTPANLTAPPPSLYSIQKAKIHTPSQSPPHQSHQQNRDERNNNSRYSNRSREQVHSHRRSRERERSRSRGRKRPKANSPDDNSGRRRSGVVSGNRRDSGRRHSRSRSGTPTRHREHGKEKEKQKAAEKERQLEQEQHERDRRRMGLPSRPKKDHLLIASRTLWFGRIPAMTSEQDIIEAIKEAGIPEKITIVGSRGCAYVTMPDRKSAYKILDKMANSIQVQKKHVKLDWATLLGVKEDVRLDYWDMKRGFAEIPFSKLPDGSIDKLMEGAWLELDSLPIQLKDRYTNTGLKQQQQIMSDLSQNITFQTIPTSIVGSMPQIMPALFNPAALISQIQLPITATPSSGMMVTPSLSMTPIQMQTPISHTYGLFPQTSNQNLICGQTRLTMPNSHTGGFFNSGFAGYGSVRGGRGSLTNERVVRFRGRGRGRGRPDFNNSHTNLSGDFPGGGYRGRGGQRDYQHRGRGRIGHTNSFQTFTYGAAHLQQSESEGGNEHNGSDSLIAPGTEDINKNDKIESANSKTEDTMQQCEKQLHQSEAESDAPPGLSND